MVYLPITMGYRNCYRRYMASLGYEVTCKPNGAIMIDGMNGKVVDPEEFVSLSTYCSIWKREYPQLKVSRPVEDICQYCYIFAHRFRYLAKHGGTPTIGGVTCVESDENGNDLICMPVADSNETGSVGDDFEDIVSTSGRVMLEEEEQAESVKKKAEEEREQLLLEAADHVNMANIQRALYQLKIEEAQRDARAGKRHSERKYTFVVDYGQNMELPVYNSEQPGCTYYFSPLSVYNLGMVDHAHLYKDGEVSEHMYAHVYHEGVEKNGANNVASLVMKTLRQLNIIREDEVGGELNIVFDNCSGQNKNNTVLKLAAWLKAAGYFECVNFIFLVVGHTKNAADRLFNSLKHEYRKKDIFTMNVLTESLNVSDSVTVIPTVPEDFFDYDKLFKDLYSKLDGVVKKNHVFSCIENDRMHIRESNLEEHKAFTRNLPKRGRRMNAADIKTYTSTALEQVECNGLNPWKMVELSTNYKPHIDQDYVDDELYQAPPPHVLALVKQERSDRSVFRAKIKEAKLSGMKERLDGVALGTDGDGIIELEKNDDDDGDGDEENNDDSNRQDDEKLMTD